MTKNIENSMDHNSMNFIQITKDTDYSALLLDLILQI